MIGENVDPTLASRSLVEVLVDVIKVQGEKVKPLAVAFYGESGSGKSVTAKALSLGLQELGYGVVRLQMDDYFFLPPQQNSQEREKDLSRVGLLEVDLATLDQHIRELKAGANQIQHPIIDFKQSTRVVETLSVPTPLDFIVVEGTYVNYLKEVDVRVFLERTYEETHIHRVARMREPDSELLREVLKIEHRIVQHNRHQADHIISKDFQLLQ